MQPPMWKYLKSTCCPKGRTDFSFASNLELHLPELPFFRIALSERRNPGLQQRSCLQSALPQPCSAPLAAASVQLSGIQQPSIRNQGSWQTWQRSSRGSVASAESRMRLPPHLASPLAVSSPPSSDPRKRPFPALRLHWTQQVALTFRSTMHLHGKHHLPPCAEGLLPPGGVLSCPPHPCPCPRPNCLHPLTPHSPGGQLSTVLCALARHALSREPHYRLHPRSRCRSRALTLTLGPASGTVPST
mmetsp:Transcript_59346/g.121573  ORF Transcript_59346/g.121573 Transcript_59346/m.121573 type:complete len:245 (-) Transcript_59346:231-965(-)